MTSADACTQTPVVLMVDSSTQTLQSSLLETLTAESGTQTVSSCMSMAECGTQASIDMQGKSTQTPRRGKPLLNTHMASHLLTPTRPAVSLTCSSAESAVSVGVDPMSESEAEYCPSSCSEASEQLQSPQQEKDSIHMVQESSLDELLRRCPTCGAVVIDRNDQLIGGMLVVKLTCARGCDVTWRSHRTTANSNQSLCKYLPVSLSLSLSLSLSCDDPVTSKVGECIILTCMYMVCGNQAMDNFTKSLPACSCEFSLPRSTAAGSILLVAAIVFSGSTFNVFSRIAEFLELSVIHKTTMYSIQEHFVLPIIQAAWFAERTRVKSFFSGM